MRHISYFIFNVFLFFSFFAASLVAGRRQLSMVQVMFRHGARHTLHGQLLENEPNKQDIIRDAGQLTEVGMRQMYIFGQMFQQKYVTEQEFLSRKFNRTEIHVLSSNVNRTLQSAQSFMFGLYPLESGQELPDEIPRNILYPPFDGSGDSSSYTPPTNSFALPSGFYPFAIHSLGENDAILNPKCQGWKQERKSLQKKFYSLIIDEIEKEKHTISKISKNHLNLSTTYVSTNVTKLWDMVYCQKQNGQDYGVSTQDFETLMFLKSYIKLLTKFPLRHSQVVASPLFYYVFKQFNLKIQGNSNLKLVVESTHDGQIVPLMVTLGLINAECLKYDHKMNKKTCERFPPFGSNFIFELYDTYSASGTLLKDKEIRILFNGKAISICGGLEYCNYSTFQSSIQQIMASPEEYTKECGFRPTIYPNQNEQASQNAVQIQKDLDIQEKEQPQSQYWLSNTSFVLLIGVIVAQAIYIRQLKRPKEDYKKVDVSIEMDDKSN